MFRTLYFERNFSRLWLAQTISLFGTNVSLIALPFTAIFFLHASALQMGLLRALGELPYLLVSVFLGVLVDKIRRRQMMVLADVTRGILVLLVPVLAMTNRLSLEFLYINVFLVGALSSVRGAEAHTEDMQEGDDPAAVT